MVTAKVVLTLTVLGALLGYLWWDQLRNPPES